MLLMFQVFFNNIFLNFWKLTLLQDTLFYESTF
jgi:hypothetical protein